MQTGTITGQGQIVTTKTNPMVKFRITTGSSIIEMKLIIPIGSQSGQIQCRSRRSEDFNITSKRAHYQDYGYEKEQNNDNKQLEINPISLRQSQLQVLVRVIPASISTLLDPFGNLNNRPSGILSSSGGSSGMGGRGSAGQGSSGKVPTSLSTQGNGYRLSDIITPASLTAVVVSTVSVSIANTVASNAVSSSSASMSNAFQMIKHAQCEYLCVRVRSRALIMWDDMESVHMCVHTMQTRTCLFFTKYVYTMYISIHTRMYNVIYIYTYGILCQFVYLFVLCMSIHTCMHM
jgi:hypothetical protein